MQGAAPQMSPTTRARPAPGGRRERRKAMVREEILLAARRLFSEKGLYESRVEEITDRADIGKGTLYRYFTSKEELILEVAARGFEELGARMTGSCSSARSVAETVAAIVEAHTGFFADNPDLLRIFHQMRGMLKFNRPEWRPLRAVLVGHLKRLTRELGRTHDGAPLAAARRRELAELLFGAVSGFLSVRVAANPDRAPGAASQTLRRALIAMARECASVNGN